MADTPAEGGGGESEVTETPRKSRISEMQATDLRMKKMAITFVYGCVQDQYRPPTDPSMRPDIMMPDIEVRMNRSSDLRIESMERKRSMELQRILAREKEMEEKPYCVEEVMRRKKAARIFDTLYGQPKIEIKNTRTSVFRHEYVRRPPGSMMYFKCCDMKPPMKTKEEEMKEAEKKKEAEKMEAEKKAGEEGKDEADADKSKPEEKGAMPKGDEKGTMSKPDEKGTMPKAMEKEAMPKAMEKGAMPKAMEMGAMPKAMEKGAAMSDMAAKKMPDASKKPESGGAAGKESKEGEEKKKTPCDDDEEVEEEKRTPTYVCSTDDRPPFTSITKSCYG